MFARYNTSYNSHINCLALISETLVRLCMGLGKFFGLYCCLSLFNSIAIDEIMRFARNLTQIYMCYAKLAVYKSLVYIFQIVRIELYTRVSQYITAYGGKIMKISFDIITEHKIL